uniref:Uncharacterized protein n=1 Tax=Oryza rufipogon TaxID=4529 RepID=A0A0E0R9F4_ORYRU
MVRAVQCRQQKIIEVRDPPSRRTSCALPPPLLFLSSPAPPLVQPSPIATVVVVRSRSLESGDR